MELDQYHQEAQTLLNAGGVREITFVGPTYQVEVFDASTQETYWPFLQVGDKGKLKDAFCSCDYEQGCPHLAAAYHRIMQSDQEPLHLRFDGSLWDRLCHLLAMHLGYELNCLEELDKGYYKAENFLIRATDPSTIQLLETLFTSNTKQTPENSIKFSNLKDEEIEWWREGRPSESLRYTLSFWSDLAKWLFVLQEDQSYTINFEEDQEGFPTKLFAKWKGLEVIFTYKTVDLPGIILGLKRVNSPLLVMQEAEGAVKHVSFDPKSQIFRIEHEKKKTSGVIGKELPGWIYRSGEGFYSKDGTSIFNLEEIPKELIGETLSKHEKVIATYLPVDSTPRQLQYQMYFDQTWDWHFEAFLFEKGDLQQGHAALFGEWAYLDGRGFFRVTDALFNHPVHIIRVEHVSNFVNMHRVWLNGQEGFQTHLASIESHLTYRVEEEALYFQAKMHESEETAESKDFGDWIYYAKQGFFSKKHVKLGQLVRPGVTLHANKISSFIKLNREELENIPGFFAARLPLESRGLEISIQEEHSLVVKPIYRCDEAYAPQFFGDFVFTEQEGFYELPAEMRLPEEYQQQKVIAPSVMHSFLSHDFPTLKKYIQKIDPRLEIPKQADIQLRYLVRNPKGGLKAQLFLITEFGEVPLTQLFHALHQKGQFLFSSGGLLDLKEERFAWIRAFKPAYDEETNILELSTLDFLRLDVSVGLLAPSEQAVQAEISKRLLKELREFTVTEPANLRGLKSELRLYQQTGLQWLWFLYRNGLSSLLCDDMGLGKTHQAMALMAGILNLKDVKERRFLVVCPTSVIYHWQDKLETFLPGVAVHTFHGFKRSLKHLPKEGVILTTYGVLRMEKAALQKIPFELAVFDEVQTAKNPHSQVHDALTAVNARMRLGLTGTPIENSLVELKALFDVVLPGYMPSDKKFREQFVNPIELQQDEEKKALLMQMIRPFILRRRKSEVLQELPEKSEDKSYCDLSEEQVKLYNNLLEQNRDGLVSELRDRDGSVPYIHVFALLSKLKQVCNHPALVAKDPHNYQKYQSGKWELFTELLNEAHESNQKVVVFSQYLHMLDIMENYLKKQGWGYAQIRGDTVDRRNELKRFQEDPECVVFIGSLQAAGLGIDLTAASVVILYDRWWNAARENQAIDRVHRIGQKWGVHVFKLISKGTIEEKIDRMIMRKGQLMEEIVTSDDQAVLKKFSRSELIDLLSYSSGES